MADRRLIGGKFRDFLGKKQIFHPLFSLFHYFHPIIHLPSVLLASYIRLGFVLPSSYPTVVAISTFFR